MTSMTGTGPSGSYAKSAKVRESIVHAAFQTFAMEGYRNGSLRDVAAKANMSEAGLLHHFPSKADLLIAVLRHRDDEARATFGFDPETGRQALGELVALARFNTTIPGGPLTLVASTRRKRSFSADGHTADTDRCA